MIKKLSSNQIIRITDIEKRYGIDDMRIYAYQCGRYCNVVGEIIANEISNAFSLSCSVYDHAGDIVESLENDYYGDTIVTSSIKPEVFFDRYPFKFSIFLDKGVKVSKIRIVPN